MRVKGLSRVPPMVEGEAGGTPDGSEAPSRPLFGARCLICRGGQGCGEKNAMTSTWQLVEIDLTLIS